MSALVNGLQGAVGIGFADAAGHVSVVRQGVFQGIGHHHEALLFVILQAGQQIGGLLKGSTYYVVEDAIKGYSIKYTNVGTAAETTDRVYDGGTITNHKIPKTGDSRNVAVWMVLALVSAMGIGAVAISERKKRRTN